MISPPVLPPRRAKPPAQRPAERGSSNVIIARMVRIAHGHKSQEHSRRPRGRQGRPGRRPRERAGRNPARLPRPKRTVRASRPRVGRRTAERTAAHCPAEGNPRGSPADGARSSQRFPHAVTRTRGPRAPRARAPTARGAPSSPLGRLPTGTGSGVGAGGGGPRVPTSPSLRTIDPPPPPHPPSPGEERGRGKEFCSTRAPTHRRTGVRRQEGRGNEEENDRRPGTLNASPSPLSGSTKAGAAMRRGTPAEGVGGGESYGEPRGPDHGAGAGRARPRETTPRGRRRRRLSPPPPARPRDERHRVHAHGKVAAGRPPAPPREGGGRRRRDAPSEVHPTARKGRLDTSPGLRGSCDARAPSPRTGGRTRATSQHCGTAAFGATSRGATTGEEREHARRARRASRYPPGRKLESARRARELRG